MTSNEIRADAPLRVLVVEDEEAIRLVLEAALADEGHDVRAARHGAEALDILQEWDADLVLLDVMMPVLDGWGFLDERRRRELAPRARVVLVSASRGARETAAARGDVAAVVSKPFELDLLLELASKANG
jgi:CheY-like chemotaxis protein